VKKKVNLFVVGAMKAGTTSFVDLLSQCPDIYVPPIKEPHFFVNQLPVSIYMPSRFFSLKAYFDKEFPKPLHITKIKKPEDYRKLYSLAPAKCKYRIDASTCYLSSPETPKQIFTYNPDSKIIILLRDPLKRAMSHYAMDVGLGRTLRSFENEILDDIEDLQNGTLSRYSYLNMSLYSNQVEGYKSYFGENVLVLEFEKLAKSNTEEFDRLNQFLEVKERLYHLPLQNKTRTLKFPFVNKLLIKIGFKNLFSIFVPTPIKQKLFQLLSSDKKSKTEISEKTLEKLEALLYSQTEKKIHQL